jgi:hypothetical protein
MAARLAVSAADLRNAQLAEAAFTPLSLDAPLGDRSGTGSLADLLGGEDRQIEHMLAMLAVAAHWHELPPASGGHELPPASGPSWPSASTATSPRLRSAAASASPRCRSPG